MEFYTGRHNLFGATIVITKRCNFACSHCYEGAPEAVDMSLEDCKLVARSVHNPSLYFLNLYGGEARLHPQFSKVAETFRRYFSPAGDFRTELGIYTNGFGMASPREIRDIVNNLADKGFARIAVSTDDNHSDFVTRQGLSRQGLSIDYDCIKKVAGANRSASKNRAALGIKPEVYLIENTTGSYILPLGRAQNFTWEQRITPTPTASYFKIRYKTILDCLQKEYHGWQEAIRFSHMCYCGPTFFYRQASSASRENMPHLWQARIEPDTSVNICTLGILPPLGHLKEMTLDQIYAKALKNQLYFIIASGGPQSLARELTSLSENSLKENFLERTPCGLCEDLMESHGDEIRSLIS